MARPTKYKPKYCEDILTYFDIPHTVEKARKKVYKDGSVYEWTEEVANILPTFERFAVTCGVVRDTLREWKKEHEEFSAAYNMAKEIQKEMIMDLGMRGFYSPAFTIFTAKNITDMKDHSEVRTGEILDVNVPQRPTREEWEKEQKTP